MILRIIECTQVHGGHWTFCVTFAEFKLIRYRFLLGSFSKLLFNLRIRLNVNMTR